MSFGIFLRLNIFEMPNQMPNLNLEFAEMMKIIRTSGETMIKLFPVLC